MSGIKLRELTAGDVQQTFDGLADRLSTAPSRSCATAWNGPSVMPRFAIWSAGTRQPSSNPREEQQAARPRA
jgi:hypothetical protein